MFNRIVLINLDKRKDRLGSMQAKLSSCKTLSGWVRERAIHGDSVGCPHWFSQGPGAWGCARSHLRVLESAILDGIDSLLVLEDDAIFADDFRREAWPIHVDDPDRLGWHHVWRPESEPAITNGNSRHRSIGQHATNARVRGSRPEVDAKALLDLVTV
jgi:hypothetical protein